MNITDKTGNLVALKVVNDEDDLMIINVSGITLRMHVSDIRVMGRATQGVKLINLEKRGDTIASICRVPREDEEEEADVVNDDEQNEGDNNISDAENVNDADVKGDENQENGNDDTENVDE